jgi:hypothetical protein
MKRTSTNSSSTGMSQMTDTMPYSGNKGAYPNSGWGSANVKGTKFSSDSPMAANAAKGKKKKGSHY